jgi:hypothetical protein
MKSSILVFAVMAVVAAATVSAQQPTCNTVSLTLTGHGHGAITVSRIWVDDPDVFEVSMDRSLPFDASEGERFDVRVCILKQDGRTYTSKLRYETNHGSEAVDVMLTAPITVADIDGDSQVHARAHVFPTLVTDELFVTLNEPQVRIAFAHFFDARGVRVRSIALSASARTPVPVALAALPPGVYHIVIEIDGAPAGTHRIVVVK